jgi:hypothetical protein
MNNSVDNHLLEVAYAMGRADQREALAKTNFAPPPVAWRWKRWDKKFWHYAEREVIIKRDEYDCEPLYPEPPHRVPLTEQELRKLWSSLADRRASVFARAVEEAHGIFEKGK